MMGRLDKRIEELERHFGVGTGQFDARRTIEWEEWREQVSEEAYKRLSDVELAVLVELLKLRSKHPEMSGAQFYSLMTPVHHAMERYWSRVLKEVVDELKAST
jgi:hypothetical protein